MQKPAPINHDVMKAVRDRWSPYAFDSSPIEAESVLRCLEAARWAASSFNEQPWQYIVGIKARNESTWQGILDCLMEGNQPWARHAPVLMLSVASKTFKMNDKPNAHAWHDTGLATAQLVLQATSEGLIAHAMAGYFADSARERFAIPETHDPVAVIALGKPGDGAELDESIRDRDKGPRVRKPMDEMVIGETWGTAPSWLSQ